MGGGHEGGRGREEGSREVGGGREGRGRREERWKEEGGREVGEDFSPIRQWPSHVLCMYSTSQMSLSTHLRCLCEYSCILLFVYNMRTWEHKRARACASAHVSNIICIQLLHVGVERARAGPRGQRVHYSEYLKHDK